ncbi:MAG: ubiquinone/menaquinone biosynthesis methyltransferase [Candidatus Marsarchaeota archaeon]|nr:ubiquinone/menaquinone biosynthesis methyltransferase [Candidatus Marsarchaeota archaeon]MCL5412906.1 ubiquinone/menaquinone biosynthesis methyltransferase [Candidatus Marsarchaeota archaeon]
MSKESMERFSRIHRHYDFFNHLFSLGTDIMWRREAAKESIINKDKYEVLDIATGTGDLAIAVAQLSKEMGKKVAITGIDINRDMLSHVSPKAERLGLGNIHAEQGNALKMRFDDASFDVVISAFGLRNFDNLETFSKELRRVMRRGGKFVLMDMAMPFKGARLMKAYFGAMRLVGSTVNRKAYRFLTDSIMHFDRYEMASLLKKSGFKRVRLRNLSGGIAFIISGTR